MTQNRKQSQAIEKDLRKEESLFNNKHAGVLGFEPRQTDPESVVLPLHHTPIIQLTTTHGIRLAN